MNEPQQPTPAPEPVTIESADEQALAASSTHPPLAESVTVLGLLLLVIISCWLYYGPIIMQMIGSMRHQWLSGQ